MEHLGNGLYASSHFDTEVDGKREERQVTKVYVQFRESAGEVTIRNEEWPEDGAEWDVCPSEWESLESDLQDWLGL